MLSRSTSFCLREFSRRKVGRLYDNYVACGVTAVYYIVFVKIKAVVSISDAPTELGA